MAETTDPLSGLIAAIAAVPQQPGTSAMDEAAKLIPGRTETNVKDLLESEELKSFRAAYRSGLVEIELIDHVLGIVKGLLVACGWLPG